MLRLALVVSAVSLVSSSARAVPLAPTSADFAQELAPRTGLRVAVHPFSLLLQTIRVSFERPVAGRWAAQVTPLVTLKSLNILRNQSGPLAIEGSDGVGLELAGRHFPAGQVQAGMYHGPMLRYEYYFATKRPDGRFGPSIASLQANNRIIGADAGYRIGYQARMGARGTFDVAFGVSAISVLVLVRTSTAVEALAGVLWASTLSVGLVF